MALGIIIAILGFGVIIFVHELGHFLTARFFGVTVNEFSIGMGPKIFSKKSKDGILYSLRLLPVGGFVSMAGEDEESDDPNSFEKKSKLARFIILFAGAFMNLVLGFIIMFVCVVSSDRLYSNKIESFLVADTNGEIVEEYQGLRAGDEIISVDGHKVGVRYDYVFTAMRLDARPVEITVRRGGEKIIIENFRFPTDSSDGITFANPSFFIPQEKNKNFFNCIFETFGQTTASVKMVVYSLVDLVSGKYSVEAVSGPVGVVSEIGESAKYGAGSVLFLLALIAINIGVFNLLPFPALDGGRILFIAIEAVIRRPVNKKIETAVNFAGLAMLLTLMIFVTVKDVISLF
ncbi:MAG: RIP metalloprotease RseP [Ruminococcaceae bacterium]|nr:RIP metalloprotease RseP [Oscillospiraceae bacterium]